MWLKRSRYGEYHKVKYKTLGSFQILDPKEQKIAFFPKGAKILQIWKMKVLMFHFSNLQRFLISFFEITTMAKRRG